MVHICWWSKPMINICTPVIVIKLPCDQCWTLQTVWKRPDFVSPCTILSNWILNFENSHFFPFLHIDFTQSSTASFWPCGCWLNSNGTILSRERWRLLSRNKKLLINRCVFSWWESLIASQVGTWTGPPLIHFTNWNHCERWQENGAEHQKKTRMKKKLKTDQKWKNGWIKMQNAPKPPKTPC